MKISKLKASLLGVLMGVAVLASAPSQAMRPTTFVKVYYPDAAMAGQAVGFYSVGCNGFSNMSGQSTPYSRIEGQMNCMDYMWQGWWFYDYVNDPRYIYE
jgi:hypothetical protein